MRSYVVPFPPIHLDGRAKNEFRVDTCCSTRVFVLIRICSRSASEISIAGLHGAPAYLPRYVSTLEL